MINRISKPNGYYHVNVADGNPTGKWFGFKVENDCIFTKLRGNDNKGALKIFTTAFNIAGKTLKSGTEMTCGQGEVISSVQLSLGSIVLFNLVEG